MGKRLGRRTTWIIGLIVAWSTSCQWNNHSGSGTLNTTGVDSLQTNEADSSKKAIISTVRAFELDVTGLQAIHKRVKRNQFLADILLSHQVTYPQIDALVKRAKPLFDFRKFKSGQHYHVYLDTLGEKPIVKHFVYEIDRLQFITVSFNDSITVQKHQKEIITKTNQVGGIIQNSLYQCLEERGTNPELLYELVDIYAWTIDFYRIQKGDAFKVIFDEQFVDGQSIGIAKVHASTFINRGDTLHAFAFKQDSSGIDFFDQNGQSLRKSFLKSPIKYSRISSRYSRRRFHPVQKRYKAHLGTDYAAARGTPIKSVGDGVVIEAKYGVYNGRYVKIRHNSTYTTQYLHMSKIKKGIRPGVRVSQGDVIGYVGSTGLATGPHVCFRFWKNGQQVDHLREKFPAAKPINEAYRNRFNVVKNDLLTRLGAIHFN